MKNTAEKILAETAGVKEAVAANGGGGSLKDIADAIRAANGNESSENIAAGRVLCIHKLNYDSAKDRFIGFAGDGKQFVDIFQYDYFVIVSAYSIIISERWGSSLCDLYLNGQDTGVRMFAMNARPNRVTVYPWILYLDQDMTYPKGEKPVLYGLNNNQSMIHDSTIDVAGGDYLETTNANDSYQTNQTVGGQVFKLHIFQNSAPSTKWTEEQKRGRIFVSFALGLDRYTMGQDISVSGKYQRIYGDITWGDLVKDSDEKEEFNVEYWVQIIRGGNDFFLIPFDYKNQQIP